MTNAKTINSLPVVEVEVSKLKPWPKNPRDIEPNKLEALKRFIKKYGLLTPLLVDGRDKATVLGGNMRLRAVRELGFARVPVRYVDVKSDKEAVEVALIDNAQFGRYVREQLQSLLGEVGGDIADIDVSFEPIDVGELEPIVGVSADDFDTEFELPTGSDEPAVKEICFKLDNEQAHEVLAVVDELVRQGKHQVYASDQHDNKRGNALYYLIKEWQRQNKAG